VNIEECHITVATPAELEHVQKIVFAAGGSWRSGDTRVKLTDKPVLCLRDWDDGNGNALTFGRFSSKPPELTYTEFITKYAQATVPCNVGEEEEYDG